MAGIDKVVPRFQDLEVLLQLLPLRMRYRRADESVQLRSGQAWTEFAGGDGPRAFHVVLMDNARTEILAGRRGDGRRCTASVARLARMLARCIGRRADHAYESVIRWADRGDPDAAVAWRCIMRRSSAVCVEPVQGVLRGLPGQDQYS